MDEKIVQEILHELLSSLETLDAQNMAVLQFLKDKGIANDKEFAPYLEQAGNASNVKWRAAGARIDYLVSGAIKAAEQEWKKEVPKSAEKEIESKTIAEDAADKGVSEDKGVKDNKNDKKDKKEEIQGIDAENAPKQSVPGKSTNGKQDDEPTQKLGEKAS